jgi:hypothetical protein
LAGQLPQTTICPQPISQITTSITSPQSISTSQVSQLSH